MIKVLILYYLSLKTTHGYEIQKFIQVNQMDSWTKIQSGSIYYALAKLAKEGFIALEREVGSGAKARKIYSITDKGREELKSLVRAELDSPILENGSDKFIVYPLLTVAGKTETVQVITAHIDGLKEKMSWLKKWQKIKVNDHTLEVERLSFEMMISGLEYQIRWHQALISQIDLCLKESERIGKLIKQYDFSEPDKIKEMEDENSSAIWKSQKEGQLSGLQTD